MTDSIENTSATTPSSELPSTEILVITSKVKAYIRAQAGLNTSGSVPEILSERVRTLCDEAIAKAKADQRKTVMDRDF